MATLVYRVLRPDEVVGVEFYGLTAKDPTAKISVRDHVDHGSQPGFESQYISTGKNLDEINRFAQIGKQYSPGPKYIATINLAGLESIDLTNQAVLDQYIPPINDNFRARNFATAFQEVLVVGHIPPESIVSVNIV